MLLGEESKYENLLIKDPSVEKTGFEFIGEIEDVDKGKLLTFILKSRSSVSNLWTLSILYFQRLP